MDTAKFYSLVRDGDLLGPVLSPSEFEGLQAILEVASKRPDISAARLAYMFATAYHETAGTMQPIEEMGSDAYLTQMYDIQGRKPQRAREMGNTSPGDGIRYCGRGFVQLTWKNNYKKATDQLKFDFVTYPTWVMQPRFAAAIMVEGMFEGWFTGAKITMLPIDRKATEQEFIKARIIINGKDRAERIAGYALKFQEYLVQAGM
jgi:predicted chitinase